MESCVSKETWQHKGSRLPRLASQAGVGTADGWWPPPALAPWPGTSPCPVLALQVCVEKWNDRNASRLHLPRPSAVALEMQRLSALGLERRVGKSILGKVPEMPGSGPCLSEPDALALPSLPLPPQAGRGPRGAASASQRLGQHLLCVAGAPGHGALPRGRALLPEGRGLGPHGGLVPPAARGRPGRAAGHRGPGTHVLAAAAPHPARRLSAGERAGAGQGRPGGPCGAGAGRPRTGTGLCGGPAAGTEPSGWRGPQRACFSSGESRGPAGRVAPA